MSLLMKPNGLIDRLGETAAIVLISGMAGSLSCSSRLHWEGGQKPHLTLTAAPRVGDIPLTVQFLAIVRGGSDTEPSLYCADAEWDFGDAKYTDRQDCPPLEDGGVSIRRTYSTVHTYRAPGTYKVRLTLKQREETVLVAKTKVLAAEPDPRIIVH